MAPLKQQLPVSVLAQAKPAKIVQDQQLATKQLQLKDVTISDDAVIRNQNAFNQMREAAVLAASNTQRKLQQQQLHQHDTWLETKQPKPAQSCDTSKQQQATCCAKQTQAPTRLSATERLALTAKRPTTSTQPTTLTTATITTTKPQQVTTIPNKQQVHQASHSSSQFADTTVNVNRASLHLRSQSHSQMPHSALSAASGPGPSAEMMRANSHSQALPTLKTLLAVQRQLQEQRQNGLKAKTASTSTTMMSDNSNLVTQPIKHEQQQFTLKKAIPTRLPPPPLSPEDNSDKFEENTKAAANVKLPDSYDKALPPLPDEASGQSTSEESSMDNNTSSDESALTSLDSMLVGDDHQNMARSLINNGFIPNTTNEDVYGPNTEQASQPKQSQINEEQDLDSEQHSSPTNSLASLPPPPPPLLLTAAPMFSTNNELPHPYRPNPPQISAKPARLVQAAANLALSQQQLAASNEQSRQFTASDTASSKYNEFSTQPAISQVGIQLDLPQVDKIAPAIPITSASINLTEKPTTPSKTNEDRKNKTTVSHNLISSNHQQLSAPNEHKLSAKQRETSQIEGKLQFDSVRFSLVYDKRVCNLLYLFPLLFFSPFFFYTFAIDVTRQ